MRVRLLATAALLTATLACAPRGPIVDAGARPEGVGGTIAGIVTDGGTPIGGRKVTAVDGTGRRFETSTASNGGYTIKVPAGDYRLEVETRAGEKVQEQPDATQVNVGDVDAGRNFVLAVATR